jgi:hypothetical protein
MTVSVSSAVAVVVVGAGTVTKTVAVWRNVAVTVVGAASDVDALSMTWGAQAMAGIRGNSPWSQRSVRSVEPAVWTLPGIHLACS